MKRIWPALGRLPTSTALAMAVALAMWIPACATDPTAVSVAVSVDDTVPSISLLNVTLDQSGLVLQFPFRSVFFDTDAGPAPFRFPTILQVPVTGGRLRGSADLIVEAVDWQNGHVIARGSGTAEVVDRHTTQASVTLTAVPPTPGTDGGASDGGDDGAPDGGAPDAGDDATPDGVDPDVPSDDVATGSD